MADLIGVHTNVAGGINSRSTGRLQAVEGDGGTYAAAIWVSTLLRAFSGADRSAGGHVASVCVVGLHFSEFLDCLAGAVAAAVVRAGCAHAGGALVAIEAFA